jgi:hypothetical protein
MLVTCTWYPSDYVLNLLCRIDEATNSIHASEISMLYTPSDSVVLLISTRETKLS